MFAKIDGWLHSQHKNIAGPIRRFRYLHGGQIPLTMGYFDFRNSFLSKVLGDPFLLAQFKQQQQLSAGYGYRLDERVIEYPWIFSRLSEQPTCLLDAGSTLNFDFLLDKFPLCQKKIVIYTLSPEQNPAQHSNVSYIYGDLRQTILRDRLFDEIVCISTLEHIGLDNTLAYTEDQRYNETQLLDYRIVLNEFRRLLMPGGKLFLTVPYGKYQNCGWLQQFDHSRLDDVIRVFDGKILDQAFYRYTPTGWVLSKADECAECEYFDFYNRPGFDADYAVAARAVACLELSR